jgi:hypothetical protein
MARSLSRPGAAPTAAGLFILLQMAAGRLLLDADELRVYVWGHPINWACALKARLGLPCPTCGLTRSVVLSLHGEIARAWNVAPGGPVAVLGCLAFASALLLLASVPDGTTQRFRERMEAAIRSGALAYAALAASVWMAGWAAQFTAALRLR